MKLKHIGAGILLAGSTMLGGCIKQTKQNQFPKAFTKEFVIKDSFVNRKLDSLLSKDITRVGGKTSRDKHLFEINKTFQEKFMLRSIQQDSIIRNLQAQIDSLKQIVKKN